MDDRSVLMSRKRGHKPLERVPSGRRAVKVPKQHPRSPVPASGPRKPPPPQHVSHAPPERPAAKPPNPRKPRLVRDVNGRELKDLMQILPDLPRPARPPARGPVRRVVRRRR